MEELLQQTQANPISPEAVQSLCAELTQKTMWLAEANARIMKLTAALEAAEAKLAESAPPAEAETVEGEVVPIRKKGGG